MAEPYEAHGDMKAQVGKLQNVGVKNDCLPRQKWNTETTWFPQASAPPAEQTLAELLTAANVTQYQAAFEALGATVAAVRQHVSIVPVDCPCQLDG